MRISFDLDEVLFVDPTNFETEPVPNRLFGRLFKERLRKGTAELIHALQERGFEVWIYTSSYRSDSYLKRLFRGYGIRFDGIVNAQRHNKEVQRGKGSTLPQKMPSHYRIALHIDDEDNILKSAVSFGFKAFRVRDPDKDWVRKVIDEAERIRRLEATQKEQRTRALEATQKEQRTRALEASQEE